MPDFTYFLPFLSALAHGWFTAMSGGVSVLAFIASGVAAWRGRPLALGVLLSLGIVGIGLASYEVWRAEYIKNAGQAYFRFYTSDIDNIGEPETQIRVNVQNDTTYPITIENISIARIWMTDTYPFLKLTQDSLQCKQFVIVNPEIAKQMASAGADIPQRWNVPNRPDIWYEFLHIGGVKIDDSAKSTVQTIIGPGIGHIFTISLSGQPISRAESADVVLCPIIVYTKQAYKLAIVCQGVASGKSNDGGVMRWQNKINDVVFPLREPTKDEQCKRI
jgi:hypothetical protein